MSIPHAFAINDEARIRVSASGLIYITETDPPFALVIDCDPDLLVQKLADAVACRGGPLPTASVSGLDRPTEDPR